MSEGSRGVSEISKANGVPTSFRPLPKSTRVEIGMNSVGFTPGDRERNPLELVRENFRLSIRILGGLLYWIIESGLHSFILNEENFTSLLLTTDLHDIWMRLPVLGLLVALGAYAQTRKDLEEQMHKLAEARERKDFLHSLLRHDLRNKAHVAQGYHELLKDFDLSETAEEHVEKASKAVGDSVDLIEKVRTLREIGEKEEIGDVSLGEAIKNAISAEKARASEKGIDIEYKDVDLEARGGHLLEELFSNLLGNSIVHSGCEKIRISAREAGEEIVVTIEDDGKGIPDEDKEKIFYQGFKKGENAGSGWECIS
ncbi:hypothetical protein AKJ63_00485 [candidate division MSBL1 archaeon SCGC-AAA259D18]|uniref:histidine kinase n=1 Tax=candidate division MSBL1 archaeon SCGC-AAA259D18 TaxID=1698262 RepID=A0A133UCG1_9EURY|nr:hypothetical protein AKJ63_00485 [candidate division MSBL1 archaeon SCGC-AAA259D18]